MYDSYEEAIGDIISGHQDTSGAQFALGDRMVRAVDSGLIGPAGQDMTAERWIETVYYTTGDGRSSVRTWYKTARVFPAEQRGEFVPGGHFSHYAQAARLAKLNDPRTYPCAWEKLEESIANEYSVRQLQSIVSKELGTTHGDDDENAAEFVLRGADVTLKAASLLPDSDRVQVLLEGDAAALAALTGLPDGFPLTIDAVTLKRLLDELRVSV